MKTQTKPKRVHLAFWRRRMMDTRCGAGNAKDITQDEALVTCPLCLYWAHRGYTAPRRMEARAARQPGKTITRPASTQPARS